MRNSAHLGYLSGVLISILLLFFLSNSSTHQLRVSGNMNTGHESLQCLDCHEKSNGSFRQQIQANTRYLFGFREDNVSFNFDVPDNKDCLDCHARKNDTHQVYRFNEPRFSEVRQAIQPQFCASCHMEHNGVRVTSEPENCQLCHQNTNLKNDVVDVSHADLIKAKAWSTCLGCHDFHGNHDMETPTELNQIIDSIKIKDYFLGGSDPYSKNKKEKTRGSREEDK